MSTWLSLTPGDLNDYLAAPQVAALRAAALGDGQTDPFLRVMPDVASRIRAEIQGCARNQLSPAPHSLPPSLKSIGCLLVLEALQTRIPGLCLSPDQKSLLAEGRAYLKRVSLGQVPIESPDESIPDGYQLTGGVEQVTSTDRKTGRNNLSGL